jgi:hypothetical protein
MWLDSLLTIYLRFPEGMLYQPVPLLQSSQPPPNTPQQSQLARQLASQLASQLATRICLALSILIIL